MHSRHTLSSIKKHKLDLNILHLSLLLLQTLFAGFIYSESDMHINQIMVWIPIPFKISPYSYTFGVPNSMTSGYGILFQTEEVKTSRFRSQTSEFHQPSTAGLNPVWQEQLLDPKEVWFNGAVNAWTWYIFIQEEEVMPCSQHAVCFKVCL